MAMDFLYKMLCEFSLAKKNNEILNLSNFFTHHKCFTTSILSQIKIIVNKRSPLRKLKCNFKLYLINMLCWMATSKMHKLKYILIHLGRNQVHIAAQNSKWCKSSLDWMKLCTILESDITLVK